MFIFKWKTIQKYEDNRIRKSLQKIGRKFGQKKRRIDLQNSKFSFENRSNILIFWDRLGAISATDFSRPKCWNASRVTREKPGWFFSFFTSFFASQFCGKPTPKKKPKFPPKINSKNIRNPLLIFFRKLIKILSQNWFENHPKFYLKMNGVV